MASDFAISARDISKRYRIGQLPGGWLLTEAIMQQFRSLGRRRAPMTDIWALKDVAFELHRGESVGVIGHNGSGKSTLLKVLSRVTPPTRGEVRVRGRVGALLEVGTGFHPELTGRENVFLNGAILGMRRSEIKRKFDEIVEFAGVEKFIDTPVKRYSSGMYLRLAFAVAAHLEPDILIVDEVLSVGDLAFQEKCLARMERVASEGRTVVFVSHNLGAVSRLCSRCLLLEGGVKRADGPTDEVIAEYVRSVRRDVSTQLADRTDRGGSGRMRFTDVSFSAGGRRIDSPVTGEDFGIVLGYESDEPAPRNVDAEVLVYTITGELMLHLSTQATGSTMGDLPSRGSIGVSVPRCPLPAGQYTITVSAEVLGEPLDSISRACELTVSEGDFFGSGRSAPSRDPVVLVEHEWRLAPAEAEQGRPRPAHAG